ncbi:hypothetical protein J2Z60_000140 [Lactobacillus colini]|uniref:DUF771 domain-containing protein n=1 Tax=Lactobacillus colini TaxID=1819254 RepID=A0ABS4MBD4_9LACO|nr:hypothetical protein [Lactobacillus colini]MBP2056978.1 hypothetical protein [Lactobacillus colini]
MKLEVNDAILTEAVDKIMRQRGYVPEDELTGKTITIREFAKKYCYPHGISWVKSEIFYRFKPDWVADLYPGRGRSFTIFEKPAAEWMEKHRSEINWKSE